MPLEDLGAGHISLYGAKVYLVAIKDSVVTKFFQGTYVAEKPSAAKVTAQLNENSAEFFTNFSGVLILQELGTQNRGAFSYTNGILVPPQPARKPVVTRTANTNEESCGYYTACYWTASCITAYQSSDEIRVYGTITYLLPDGPDGPRFCTTPLIDAPQCASRGWQNTSSEIVYRCSSNFYEYTPPTPPSYPGYTSPAPPLSESYKGSLYTELLNNRDALLLPCPGLTDAWRPIVEFRPPQAIRDKLDYLSTTGFSSGWDQYYVQNLKDAWGPTINLDRYSIQFSQLPIVNGQRLTMEQTLNYIRLNLSIHTGTVFTPQTQTGQNEATLWNSNNPTGAVVCIDLSLIDTGDVIVSDYSKGYNSVSWTFSTIHDPFSHDHPVSGTRVFGMMQTANGYEFYTMGADRLTGMGDAVYGWLSDVRENGQNPQQFDLGHDFWAGTMNNLQNKLFTPQGIPSSIPQPIENHPDFSQLQYILNNNLPLSNLDC